jgi:hypothetical protein
MRQFFVSHFSNLKFEPTAEVKRCSLVRENQRTSHDISLLLMPKNKRKEQRYDAGVDRMESRAQFQGSDKQ